MTALRSMVPRRWLLLLVFVLACRTASAFHEGPCKYPGALLLATGDVAVKQMEMTFNETKQEYEETGTTLYFTRPQSGAVRMLSAVREMYDKLNPRLCLRSFDNFDPCCTSSSDECGGYRHRPTEMCMKSPVGTAHSTQFVQSTGGRSYADGCSYDGTLTKWNLTAVDNHTLVHTWTSDREIKPCNGPAKRLIRREIIIYKVVQGCLLGAQAPDCDPGVATCKPCAAGNVAMQKYIIVQIGGTGDVSKTITYCRPRTAACALNDYKFMGCPAATQAEGYNATTRTVNCTLCPVNTYNPMYPDPWTGVGLKVQCLDCPDYLEAPGLGNTGCRGCKPGQYATGKTPPINCTDCPAGTFTDRFDQSKCTKCPEFFYQNEAGRTSCKRCPTEWRCLVPANLLDQFQYTPFRWDASGNPQCVTLNGKECWKDTTIPCSKKLQMLPELMKQGKIIPLTCGEQHKKIWKHTGYESEQHWCSISKKVFMIPGKANIGATSCGAVVTNMTLPQPLNETVPSSSCNCPMVNSCAQVCSLV